MAPWSVNHVRSISKAGENRCASVRRVTLASVGLGLALALLGAVPQVGASAPPAALIELEWSENNRGVEILSDDYLFSFLAEDCDGLFFETYWSFPGTKTYVFFLNIPIVKVWVTAGWNETETGPSGEAQLFVNEGVDCSKIPVFPTMLAGVAAVAVGAASYATVRRRK